MNKMIRKAGALLAAFSMVLSMAACSSSQAATAAETAASTAAASESQSSTEEKTTGELVKYLTAIDGGEITTSLADTAGGKINYDIYAGTTGKDYTDEKVYTYHDYLASTTSLNWSPLNYPTAQAARVLRLLSDGLYTYAFNSDLSGWSVEMALATEVAEDVTSQYVGQYGIQEGETSKAFRFTLNPLACWEDGTPINADTYVYSYQQLLDPLMKNRQADEVYENEFALAGAREYFYQGQIAYTDNGASGEPEYTMADLTLNENGQYVTADGKLMYIGLGYALTWLSGKTLADYVESCGTQSFDVTNWDALYAQADENGLIPLTEENYQLFVPVTTGNSAWGETEENVPNYFVYAKTYGAASWDDVGVLKTGDYELVLIYNASLENPEYFVPYNMSDTFLVYEPLWESCKKYYNSKGEEVSKDNDDIAYIQTTYGTTVETTMSYGPYKMAEFEQDKSIKLVRNENWYGYQDGLHLGQYQTDNYEFEILAEHNTRLLSFLSGEIDSVDLEASDMEKYSASRYIRYTPQSYTTKLSWNTDPETLSQVGTNAQVLTSLKFREAFSLAIDANKFAASYTAAGTAGYGILNYLYVYDLNTGAAYRDTDAAKAALCAVYGMTYGADGDYDTLDEAYEAITGYDIDKARELMQEAYEELTAAGVYDGTSDVKLRLDVYQSDDSYVQMFNFLQDALQNAAIGTGFEGKLSMEMVANSDYYSTMYAGGTDMIFTTWGGAASLPYGMLYQCYCDDAYGEGNQMEYGFDTSKIMVSLTIDGKEFTESLQTWARYFLDPTVIITSKDGSYTLDFFTNYSYQTRAELFAAMEYAYLANYTTTPIYYRNSASLISQKVSYPVDQYMDLMGFGGVAEITYNYSDEEWEAVRSTLTY